MKNIIQNTLMICLLFGIAKESVHAQDRGLSIINYSPSMTLGDAKDFADQFSFRGVEADIRFFPDQSMSIGFLAGWNVFREASDGVISEVIDQGDNELTLSANQYKYINMFPFLLTGHYYFGESNGPRPYVGLGVGAFHIIRRVEMGLFLSQDEKLHFGIAPMAGVVIPTASYTSIHLGIQYNNAFKSGDAAAASTLGFDVGVAYRFR